MLNRDAWLNRLDSPHVAVASCRSLPVAVASCRSLLLWGAIAFAGIFYSETACSAETSVGDGASAKASSFHAPANIESRLQKDVTFLAADEREGRGTGTKGLDQAAEYIANEFSQIGLRTDAIQGAPFQSFEVVVEAKLGPTENNQLTIVGPPGPDGQPRRFDFRLGDDFNTLALGGSREAKGGLVLVGYGITAKEHKYDDYAGIDVKDKIVIIVRKEPQQGDEKSVFGGKNATSYATFDSKVSNAHQRGAAAVILVNDQFGIAGERVTKQKQRSETAERLAEAQAEFAEKEQPTADESKSYQKAVEQLQNRLKQLDEWLAGDGDELLPTDAAGYSNGSRQMAVFFAKRAMIDPIIQSALGFGLDEMETRIDASLKPVSADLPGWRAEVESSIEYVKANTRNVLAVLEGSGSLANETVVVGAHYDHLGMGGRDVGSLAPWTRAIHNGADDNASGTAVLLEVARQLARHPRPDSRRILFAAFTAEERGLLGSKHYVQNPLFPLEKTAAMVNLDMVGRLNDNKLIVYGTGTSSSFDGLIEGLNKKYAFELKKDPAGEGPSDHQSFYRKNVPVFHFFTGSHSDYHRPSDDSERINVEGMRRITEMVTELVQHLVIVPERPDYVAVKGRAVIVQTDRPRASLGILPDYDFTEEGCRLESVRKGGPAEKAGLQAGDVIIRMGNSEITGLEDFDKALRSLSPGKVIKVQVSREGQRMEMDVTLGQSRG